MRIMLISLILICLGGCGAVGFPGVYKINVEQGNIITQEMVDQLKPGMNKRQVRFILGTPLLEDTFNQDRWDYTYVTRNGRNVIAEQHLTVHFDDDALTRFTGSLTPTPAQDTAEAESEENEASEESEG